MDFVKITPSKLYGEVTVPPSKSLSHRAVIAAGLSKGTSVVDNIIFSEDITATCKAMEALGVNITKESNSDSTVKLTIKGSNKLTVREEVIDCSESGSTIRFFIPIALIEQNNVTFTGRGKLVTRPLKEYYDIFEDQGIEYSTTEGVLPLTVNGQLKAGKFNISGDVSSQFITGLLFTLPLLDGDSEIVITKKLESKGYVDLTLDVLNKYAIEVENDNYRTFRIKGNQAYKEKNYRVEGDFSQAAFWLVAGAVGGRISCSDLNSESLQGDKAIIDIMKEMSSKINEADGKLVSETAKTKAAVIDGSQCPDIIPVLSVLAAVSSGTTEIINAGRLRIKECDRLKAMATELTKLGANIEEKEEGLIIRGKSQLKGGEVDSWNDHRIAMALAVASIKCTESVTIKNSGSVKKSYPTFWEDFKKLGGKINEWNVG